MTRKNQTVKYTAINHATRRVVARTGLEVTVCSKQVGLSESYLWNVVNGRRGMSGDVIRHIAPRLAKMLGDHVSAADIALELLGINPDGSLVPDPEGGTVEELVGKRAAMSIKRKQKQAHAAGLVVYSWSGRGKQSGFEYAMACETDQQLLTLSGLSWDRVYSDSMKRNSDLNALNCCLAQPLTLFIRAKGEQYYSEAVIDVLN